MRENVRENRDTHPRASEPLLPHTADSIPDRVTFTCPQRVKRSPFGGYKPTATNEQAFDSTRFLHRRLGISAETFENELSHEIDEVLREIETKRRQELLENLPLKQPSQEEARRLLQSMDLSTSGALYESYRWAAGLGTTRFNFDFDFDRDDISILDAYD